MLCKCMCVCVCRGGGETSLDITHQAPSISGTNIIQVVGVTGDMHASQGSPALSVDSCYKTEVYILVCRDFAYVARDRATRVHMCHVFQCDTPARQIANTLRDICKRIMKERGLVAPPVEPRPPRPTDLPNLDKLGQPLGHGPNSSSSLFDSETLGPGPAFHTYRSCHSRH